MCFFARKPISLADGNFVNFTMVSFFRFGDYALMDVFLDCLLLLCISDRCGESSLMSDRSFISLSGLVAELDPYSVDESSLVSGVSATICHLLVVALRGKEEACLTN